MVGVRDPFGIRPLVIESWKTHIFASETCALDIVGAEFIREIDNGEIVIIENGKLSSIKPFPKQKSRPCVFEYIYFARPDSLIGGKCAYEYRKNLGRACKRNWSKSRFSNTSSRFRSSSCPWVCRTIK